MNRRTQHQSAPTLRRTKRRRGGGRFCHNEVLSALLLIVVILSLAIFGLVIEYQSSSHASSTTTTSSSSLPPHLLPIVPALPIFGTVPNDEKLVLGTLSGKNPTMAGITAILQRFVFALHQTNLRLVEEMAEPVNVIQEFFNLVTQHLRPLDEAYRGRSIFPIRDDESIFLSLAAFREHLLADTLEQVYRYAKDPQKLFVGVVVQNCFGNVRVAASNNYMNDGSPSYIIDPTGTPCKTGAQVIGKNKNGKDMTKVSDAPPDVNGIVDFCSKQEFRDYCTDGHIRVLYVHETESLGPAMARYYASKLWGGETYYAQADSHLKFASQWDTKYIQEIHATRNYPKSVLSSYPPGFQQQGQNATSTDPAAETKGARLCRCDTDPRDPNPIVRINVGRGYRGDEPRPTQIPYIAAGFFFAHAQFLVDVPFDPYIPWCFMGEEIALSMRAWTRGWDIYAPRVNLIAHQYRPGRMGLPKFWGTVNRLFKKPNMNNRIQSKIIKRIKHMVGYPDSNLEVIQSEGIEFILKDIEQYGIGSERSWQDYMDFAHMSIDKEHDVIVCSKIEWCNKGLKD